MGFMGVQDQGALTETETIPDRFLRIATDLAACGRPSLFQAMNQERDQEPPARKCDVCASPMVLLSTLPSAGAFPMQHVYKCPQCRTAVADTVER